MPLTWKKEFAIGVPEIDKQHQLLFNRFDQFLEAIDQGKGERELEDMKPADDWKPRAKANYDIEH